MSTLWHLIFVAVAAFFGARALWSMIKSRRVETACYTATVVLLLVAVTR